MTSQKQVWDNLAKDWHKFKIKPAIATIEFLKNKRGKILDLGSGSGRNLVKNKNSKIYLVDFSAEMIKLAKQKAKKENINAEFFVAELNKLPFEDNFFDYAICISALHCVQTKQKREKAVKELFRVLKNKGQAKIGVWNKNSKRFKNSSKEKMIGWLNKGKRYYYLFEEKEVHELFKKVGFKIIKQENSELMINFIVEK